MKSFPVVPRVSLRPDERAQRWLLSISASDRSGLLYSVARVLAQYRINLQLAKVSTLGERVEDTFLVDGAALQNNRLQIQVETELLDAICATRAERVTRPRGIAGCDAPTASLTSCSLRSVEQGRPFLELDPALQCTPPNAEDMRHAVAASAGQARAPRRGHGQLEIAAAERHASPSLGGGYRHVRASCGPQPSHVS